MSSAVDKREQRASLEAIRSIWASRRGARSRTDIAYLVYLVVLSIAVLVIPVLRAIGMGLARPDVVPVLLADAAPRMATAVVLMAAAALLLAGAVRGPALLAPFFTTTLAAGPIRRRAVLWRPFVRSVLVPVTGCTTVAALIGITLLTVGRTDLQAAAWFLLASVGTGLLLGACWFLGELLRGTPRRILAVVLVLLGVLCAAVPVPIGPGAAYPLAGGDSAAWAIGLIAIGTLAVVACVPGLDRLRGAVLLEQAMRWETASTSATTGDLTAAAGTFRARASTGRRLPAIGGGPMVLLYARRDAVAWLRTPERSVIGVLGAGLSACALGWGLLGTGPLAWAAIAVGTLGTWAASSSFVDGIRHAVHTLGAPALLGQSAAVQAVLHFLAPTLLLGAMGALGGVVSLWGTGAAVGSDGGGGAAVPAAVLVPVALAPVLVALRVHAAAKGPMPLHLATPMPTAQGDLSVFPMLVWQSDAILLALMAGGLLAVGGMMGALWLLLGVVLLVLGIVLMTRSRFRELRS